MSRYSVLFLLLWPLLLLSGVSARTVTDATGQITVPDRPLRIVALTNESTEALLALGVTPVGAVRSWHGDPWYDHIKDRMEGVALVGDEFKVDLKAVADLKPDLIIANLQRQVDIHGKLVAIAPTVSSEVLFGAWKSNLRLYAAALGKEGDAEKLISDFDRRAADITAALGGRLSERVSLVRFMSSVVWAYNKNTFGGSILSQIGLGRPAAQDVDSFNTQIEMDDIPKLDADHLVYYVFETGDGAATRGEAEWTADPRWKALTAARNGQVHHVSDAVWTTAGGVLAANLVLDDIRRIFGL